MYDAKSDVWAFGVVSYELLTCGQYPFTANNQAALILRILHILRILQILPILHILRIVQILHILRILLILPLLLMLHILPILVALPS